MTDERKAELRAAVLKELHALDGEPASLRTLAIEAQTRRETLRPVLAEMVADGLIVAAIGYHGHGAWKLPVEVANRDRSIASESPIDVVLSKETMPDTKSAEPPDLDINDLVADAVAALAVQFGANRRALDVAAADLRATFERSKRQTATIAAVLEALGIDGVENDEVIEKMREAGPLDDRAFVARLNYETFDHSQRKTDDTIN